jgi:hypothetical protein
MSSVEPRSGNMLDLLPERRGERREARVRVAGITPLPGVASTMQTASFDVSLCNRFVDESSSTYSCRLPYRPSNLRFYPARDRHVETLARCNSIRMDRREHYGNMFLGIHDDLYVGG